MSHLSWARCCISFWMLPDPSLLHSCSIGCMVVDMKERPIGYLLGILSSSGISLCIWLARSVPDIKPLPIAEQVSVVGMFCVGMLFAIVPLLLATLGKRE